VIRLLKRGPLFTGGVMARRVGGVAIVDTPEVMVALPLAPNAPEIKGFGG
jgi:hypothetical protein